LGLGKDKGDDSPIRRKGGGVASTAPHELGVEKKKANVEGLHGLKGQGCPHRGETKELKRSTGRNPDHGGRVSRCRGVGGRGHRTREKGDTTGPQTKIGVVG